MDGFSYFKSNIVKAKTFFSLSYLLFRIILIYYTLTLAKHVKNIRYSKVILADLVEFDPTITTLRLFPLQENTKT